MFGEGATYDSIEGQFRSIRALAKKMREEIENGHRPEAPLRGSKVRSNGGSGQSTPRKSRGQNPDGDFSGTCTPTKRGARSTAGPSTPTASSARAKKAQGVLTGRVTKASNSNGKSTPSGASTPTKRPKKNQTEMLKAIKKENVRPADIIDLDIMDDDDAMYEDDDEVGIASATGSNAQRTQRTQANDGDDDYFEDIDSFPICGITGSALQHTPTSTPTKTASRKRPNISKPSTSAGTRTDSPSFKLISNPFSTFAPHGNNHEDDGEDDDDAAYQLSMSTSTSFIIPPGSSSYAAHRQQPDADADIDTHMNAYSEVITHTGNHYNHDHEDDEDDNPGVTTSATSTSTSASSSTYFPYNYGYGEDEDEYVPATGGRGARGSGSGSISSSASSASQLIHVPLASRSGSNRVGPAVGTFFDEDEIDIHPGSGTRMSSGYYDYDDEDVLPSGGVVAGMGHGAGLAMAGYGYIG
ncbi:hypothetical protein L228DRAFT_173824 [Xylona heveae TC161]|uniref:Uncharacterized protein n=1 Tax=Xylona heveae (strain CBS 132557 / TC161) TaxID=1328760 RepID=A0A165AIZ4_XYLHT|nr:hypothetical protein L228DRAFT_173824 [Xylona heveae TC161]KZF20559.1 hypothetical protein L228DRAFT_173824 [Xylona heveae TC161]